MVFKNTSCAKRARLRAFIIAEYMVATSVGLMVLAAALTMWAYSTRTCALLMNYMDLANSSKVTMDSVSQQIRRATKVTSCSSNQLVLQIPSPSGSTTETWTYAYSSTAQTLTQTRAVSSNATSSKVLLTGCSNFAFTVYQRTPISNSFDLWTNAFSPVSAKVVQMKWICARKLTGSKGQLETQASANVVMRNP